MVNASELESIRKAASSCTYCGACQAVCPVFDKVGAEAACSRGRLLQLRLMAEGVIDPNASLAESITRCALCKACEATCSSNIHTTELFMRFRRAVADHTPLPLAKRIAFTALGYRRIFDLCLRLGAPFQKLLFKDAPEGPGSFSRLPIPAAGLNKRRLIPKLSTQPLRSRVSPVTSPRGAKKMRVAFFPGCMLTYVYPEAGKAVVDVLTAIGMEVVLPDAIGCCGTPAITSGDFVAGRTLAEMNIKALEATGAEAVITACATCGTALNHEYGMVLDDSPYSESWARLKANVYDFSDFLVKFGEINKLLLVEGAVTYHDPCHLVRGMGVSAQPRQLLAAIPGLELREMKDADRCCGCAGTFSAVHYDLASKINDDKIANIKATGAATVATGCSACRMHIEDGLSRNGLSNVRVLHTAQIIARAMGCAG
jgi:Fe-S oxidoreductase